MVEWDYLIYQVFYGKNPDVGDVNIMKNVLRSTNPRMKMPAEPLRLLTTELHLTRASTKKSLFSSPRVQALFRVALGASRACRLVSDTDTETRGGIIIYFDDDQKYDLCHGLILY